jgi:meiosis-specific protein
MYPLTQDYVNCISIVEAYTFNFRVRIIYIFDRIKILMENQYYNVPGTDTVVPILSLGDNLQRMSLKDKDPITEAVLKGNAPTLREVKRSVKVRFNNC